MCIKNVKNSVLIYVGIYKYIYTFCYYTSITYV